MRQIEIARQGPLGKDRRSVRGPVLPACEKIVAHAESLASRKVQIEPCKDVGRPTLQGDDIHPPRVIAVHCVKHRQELGGRRR